MTTTIDKMLARAAELEQRAAALRIAAAEMNGHATSVKQQRLGATLASAAKVRRQQRAATNGAGEPIAHEAKLSAYKATQARRAAKNETILAILREHKRPMKLTALKAAAKEAGITSLTGINGLVRSGHLRAKGAKGPGRAYRYVGA